ncbi:MAG TPA: P-loop NTPase fold protein [Verrucomicrobiae bacterium]
MWSDRETHLDCLGYGTYVSVLSNVCTHKDLAPLTLGIFGPWGSGKTSLMKMLMREIDASKGGKKRNTLWFNAWMYEGREEAQSALIHAILTNLQKDLSLTAEAKQLAAKLKKGASVLKLGKFIMKSAVTMTPDVDGFLDCFENESEKVAQTMESFENDFSELLKLAGIDRIVVFIDDLDRCSSMKVIETFETIKLFLNTPACTFVIGADAEKIQQAVGEVYQVSDLKRQKDYLEKIVQIPFSIPAQNLQDIGCYVGMLLIGRHLNDSGWADLAANRPAFYKPSGELVDPFCKWVNDNAPLVGGAQKPLTDELTAILPNVDTLARGLRGNPRQIKRFLNILSLRRQLVAANNLSNVTDAMLVKVAVLEYVWSEFFFILAETIDPQTGCSELLAQIELSLDENAASERSSSVNTFLGEPGLVDFILSEPKLDGAINLKDYLFLAQTSLSRGQVTGIVSVDEKTKQLVRVVSGSDTTLSRSAAKRAAHEPTVAAAVVRQLATMLPSVKEHLIATNIIMGLGHICGIHKDLYKATIKVVGEVDASNTGVALAASTFLEGAKKNGIEVPAAITEKFTSASKLVNAFGTGKFKPRRLGGK